MGATFDPSGLYRFNAVMRWLADERITPGIIHVHAKALQHHFLRRIGASALFEQASLVVPSHETRRGNFLTFQTPDAQAIHRDLADLRVVTDVRGTRLRLGFGIYQTEKEVDDLVRRIDEAGARKSCLSRRPPLEEGPPAHSSLRQARRGRLTLASELMTRICGQVPATRACV